jgi:protein-S-isoprenylcysteine O-methyltransferase Ste14
MPETGTSATPDSPGVIMKPPYLYLSFLALGIIVDLAAPMPLVSTAWRLACISLGSIAVMAGIALIWVAMRWFSAAGTNVPTNLPVTALVTGGPYGMSRNPIYIGLTAIYIGLGIAFNNGWVLLFILPLLVLMRYGVIGREERYLEAKFGESYRAYRRSVRRWL